MRDLACKPKKRRFVPDLKSAIKFPYACEIVRHYDILVLKYVLSKSLMHFENVKLELGIKLNNFLR